MKINEIKELTAAELNEKLAEQRAQLTQMRLNHTITPLENPAQIKETRRTIARLLSEIRLRDVNK